MNERGEYPIDMKLFWNVQFIYELHLAQLELQRFDIEYKVSDNLRTFNIKNSDTDFLKRTAYFERVGAENSLYSSITAKNVTRSINQYLSHWFYPYKGKFHPQMIRALLNYIKIQPGEKVLDPFIGSGTTALEAQLLGIDCIGVDISEVCSLISNVKTKSLEHLDQITKFHQEIQETLEKNSLAKSEEGVISSINNIVSSIKKMEVRNFFRVAELIAHSDRSRRRKKDFTKSFVKNSAKMLSSINDYFDLQFEQNLVLGETQIYQGDSRNLQIETNSIDGIVTSPPYSIALDYVENDKHALVALGHDVNKIRENFIGVRGKGVEKIKSYNQDMKKIYFEMDRVLKDGKYIVIVIGNARINKEEIQTVEMTIQQFLDMGYKLERNIEKIIFGLYNIMQKENILIFKKKE